MKERFLPTHDRFWRLFMRSALVIIFVLKPSWILAAKFPQIYILDQQYRFSPTDSRCSVHGLCYATKTPGDGGHDYSLNFIEFRDNGDLFNPAELDAAVKQLDDARTNAQKVTVFIYIHGWHNNAGERDQGKGKRDCGEHLFVGDVAKFQYCGLKVIADNGPPTTGKAPRVVGIYLAWHGEDFTPWSLLLPYYVPSYPIRRHFAYKVGQSGMEKALQKILCVIQEHRSSYFVVAMGHSFGARALENADLMLAPAYPKTRQPSNGHVDKQVLQPQPRLNLLPSSELEAQTSSTFNEEAQLLPPQPPLGQMPSLELQVQESSNVTEEAQLLTPQVPLGRLPSSELPIDLVFYVNAATSRYRTTKTISDWNAQCSPQEGDLPPVSHPLITGVSLFWFCFEIISQPS
jgi:hypothetical protein